MNTPVPRLLPGNPRPRGSASPDFRRREADNPPRAQSLIQLFGFLCLRQPAHKPRFRNTLRLPRRYIGPFLDTGPACLVRVVSSGVDKHFANMCAGLIDLLKGTFNPTTTKLEKITPSLARAARCQQHSAAPPQFVQVYTYLLAQASPRQPEFGRFFLVRFFPQTRSPNEGGPLGGIHR